MCCLWFEQCKKKKKTQAFYVEYTCILESLRTDSSLSVYVVRADKHTVSCCKTRFILEGNYQQHCWRKVETRMLCGKNLISSRSLGTDTVVHASATRIELFCLYPHTAHPLIVMFRAASYSSLFEFVCEC